MQIKIPEDHPRVESLRIREKLVEGMRNGLVAEEGLIAHGRGEAFDYLIGENTSQNARNAIRAAAAMLLISNHPVLSVNGNFAALCAKQIIDLSMVSGALIEINLFYHSIQREEAIKNYLEKFGATNVLGTGVNRSEIIPQLSGARNHVDQRGIGTADTVFVPMEDGDRTKALVRLGKKVITVDLNPLSRTAVHANISIVDNVVRVIPILIQTILKLGNGTEKSLTSIIDDFDNGNNLQESLKLIRLGGSNMHAVR
jgi:4-phosphopantoate---beta-alanine ligase